MIAIVLIVSSAAIALSLGVLHLVFTFRGPKFLPRDPSLQIRMEEIAPVISKQTTMWRCWIGFNASHSMGVILFGLIYGYLAITHAALLFQSPFLLVVGLGMLLGYAVLAKLYWFIIPFTGISLALGCYVLGVVAALY